MAHDPASANTEESDDTVTQKVKPDLLRVSDDLARANTAADEAIESFQRADRNRVQRETDVTQNNG